MIHRLTIIIREKSSVDKQVKWTNSCQIRLNSYRGKVFHMGVKKKPKHPPPPPPTKKKSKQNKNNKKHKQNKTWGTVMPLIEYKFQFLRREDLGTVMHNKLTFEHHTLQSVKKSYRTAGLISHNTQKTSADIMVFLFKH